MHFALPPAVLEQRMSDQQRLADLATQTDIAAMHRALAAFYHEQLVRTITEPEPISRPLGVVPDRI